MATSAIGLGIDLTGAEARVVASERDLARLQLLLAELGSPYALPLDRFLRPIGNWQLRTRSLALDRPVQAAAARRLVLVAGTGEGADLEIGFVVDDVPQVRQVSLADLSAPLVEPSSGQPGVLIGITADMLTVLDVDKLLRDPRLVVQEAFSQ